MTFRLIQDGSKESKIVIVGDAPDKREQTEGRPFGGGSGDLLTTSMGRVGIVRSECFMTNVCHQQPPGNIFNRFLKPTPKLAYIQGLIQLKADIEEIKPNLVIALGAEALQALTQKTAIAKWRGSILESKLIPGIKVVATWNPRYVVKLPEYKMVTELDLLRCRRESMFPEIHRPKREFIINPSGQDLNDIVNELLKSEWLAVDIETPYDPESDGSYKVLRSSYSDHPSRALMLDYDTAERKAMTKILMESKKPKKILQNGWQFDVMVLWDSEGIEIVNYAYDTMIAQHALYPECASSSDEIAALTNKKRQSAIGKGMAFLNSINTDEPFYKDDGKQAAATGDLTLAWNYSAKDAALTIENQLVQLDDMAEVGCTHTFDFSMAYVNPCIDVARRGIPVDMEVRETEKKRLEQEIENLQNFLDSGAGKHINVKSPDVGWLLFEKIGLPPIKTSDKTGKASADKDVINALAEKHDNPLLMCILEIRERRDLIERYLDATVDSDNRMRFSVDITGTRTGRVSTRKSIYNRGTNMQTIPAGLRHIFAAEPGKVMFYIDLSQAEARVVAWYARCETLMNLFSDPTRDVHKENASRFYKLDLADVTYEQRYVAKRVIHGSNYGLAPPRLMRVVNNDYRDTGMRIDLATAEFGQDAYFMLYPEIKETFWGDVDIELRESRTLWTPDPFNRRRVFYARYDYKMKETAYAYKPQGGIGELTSRAHVTVFNDPEIDCEIFLNMHDALLGQCDEDKVHDVIPRIQAAMAIPMTIHGQELLVPTDVELGRNWGPATETNPEGLKKWKQQDYTL